MDGMFKNSISRNIRKCELGWFSLRQSHIVVNIQIHTYNNKTGISVSNK